MLDSVILYASGAWGDTVHLVTCTLRMDPKFPRSIFGVTVYPKEILYEGPLLA